MISTHVADQLIHGRPVILASGALRKWRNGPPKAGMDDFASESDQYKIG